MLCNIWLVKTVIYTRNRREKRRASISNYVC